MKLSQAIARKVAMFHASENSGDYAAAAEALTKEHMPSGSGFDSGTRIVLEKSSLSKLMFNTSFHHMNDAGVYDGWTHHSVTLHANLDGHYIVVTGRNRNGIKEHIENIFDDAFNEEVNVW